MATGDLDESGEELVDAFGNFEIAMRRDTNRDGRIDLSDTGNWVGVEGAESSSLNPTALPEAIPTNGVRAGVVFYSAGRGRDENDLVLSWK